MVSVLVTGTNQGIGFGIVEELAKRPDVDHIFASVRDLDSAASVDVKKLEASFPNVHVIQLQLDEKSAAVSVFTNVLTE
jgi:NAD(P)-dependent dehydrogenase (short-subunit alcohol dehydrogenase family)